MSRIRIIFIVLWCFSNFTFALEPYQSLFNGKDLSGWTVKCRPEDSAKSFWSVQDEAIICDSLGNKDHDYVWLVSDEEFSDFTLRLKFQIQKDHQGNSGVQIRSRYDDPSYWMNGPQVDIHPPNAMRAGLLYDETKGVQRWIYPSLEPGDHKIPRSATNPAVRLNYGIEAWNELVIEASGPNIKTFVNGELASDFQGEDILNDVAHKARNVGMSGHIALQLHAKDELNIRFKDIEILPLASRPTDQAGTKDFVPFFNGKNFDGFDLHLRSKNAEEFPKVFTIADDGVLHIFRELPADYGNKTNVNSTHGIMVTQRNYSRYHLTFDYKWGPKLVNNHHEWQYDAGMFYHITKIKVFPDGLQYQVRYDHTKNMNHSGDILGPITRQAYTSSDGKYFVSPSNGGIPAPLQKGIFAACPKATFHGLDDQWNHCELIVMGDEYAIHKLNGKVVNLVTQLGVAQGPIALETETGEIFWRNLVIQEFDQSVPMEQFLK